MLSKIFIVIVMGLVLLALMRGLFFLVSDQGTQRRTLHALTFRVMFSLIILIFLAVAYHFHWLVPHDIGG